MTAHVSYLKTLPSLYRMVRIMTMNKQNKNLPQACCINCIFLRDPDASEQPVPSLSSRDRDALREGRPISAKKLICYQLVWGEKMVDGTEDLLELLRKDQGERCLFYPYATDTSPAAAKHFEKRVADRREAEKDRRWVKIGVWVAAIALILNLGWEAYKYLSARQILPTPIHQPSPSEMPAATPNR
jgi:hypothetical protein